MSGKEMQAGASIATIDFMLQYFKDLAETVLNCRIYRNSLPRGTDLFIDLDRAFGLHRFKTVFDVGANIGQSAVAYLKHFSDAQVYSFEPVHQTFLHLDQLRQRNERLHTFQCAMGKQRGHLSINVSPNSLTSSIRHYRDDDVAEEVAVDTISEFCAAHDIQQIDFLKIDTEGYEPEVLAGCQSLLQNQLVKIVYAECEPIGSSDYFASLPELATLLSPFGYELFGIYGQQPHWDGKRSILYVNPAFVSSDLVAPEKQL